MLTDEIKKQFARLVSRLEPENLTCDGECSRSQAQARLKQIRAEWRKLEKQVGRAVKREEVYNWYLS